MLSKVRNENRIASFFQFLKVDDQITIKQISNENFNFPFVETGISQFEKIFSLNIERSLVQQGGHRIAQSATDSL